MIPSTAPSRVNALINKIMITTYGKSAKKYEAFPCDLMPLTKTKNIITQASKSHRDSFQSGQPMPSDMSFFSFKISLL